MDVYIMAIAMKSFGATLVTIHEAYSVYTQSIKQSPSYAGQS